VGKGLSLAQCQRKKKKKRAKNKKQHHTTWGLIDNDKGKATACRNRVRKEKILKSRLPPKTQTVFREMGAQAPEHMVIRGSSKEI